jgi:O-antigen/teichoic acid export membrane protein
MSSAKKGTAAGLVSNTLANSLGQIALMVLVFVGTPYVTHHMGSTTYGALVLLSTYIETFGVLNLGINSSIVKYVSENRALGRADEVQAYFGTSLTLFVSLGAAIALLIAVLSGKIVARMSDVPPDLHSAIVVGFWIASVAFLLRFVGQVFYSAPIAAQRFDLVNYVTVGGEIIRVAGAILVIYLGYSLRAVLLMMLVAALFGCVANIVVTKHLYPTLSLWPSFSKRHFWEICHFSKYIFVANISSRITDSLDKIIIGAYLPIASVAYYSIPYMIGQKVWSLVANFVAVVFPTASSFGATGIEKLRELYLRSSKMICIVASFPFFMIFAYGKEILFFWVGADFANNGSTPIRFLALAFYITSICSVSQVMLQAIGQPKLSANYSVFQAISNLILFVLMIPKFGIVGAAFSFTLSQCLFAPWIISKSHYHLKCSVRELVQQSFLLPVVFASIVTVAIAPLALRATNLLLLCSAMALAGLVYVVLIALFALDKRERDAIGSLLRRHPAANPSTAVSQGVGL